MNRKPLISYSIKTAKLFAANHNADLTLSTDDEQIKKAASDYGLTTNYTRPAPLATDNAGKTKTIEDILLFEEKLKKKRYDYLLDLDVTSPLRSLDDLEKGFEIIQNDPEAYNLFSVSPANRNPYFNMVERKETGYYSLIKTGEFLTRQSAPVVYDMNASFYFYRRSFFELENQKTVNEKSLVYIMPHICFDLDHQVDFEFMQYLIENNKLDFDL